MLMAVCLTAVFAFEPEQQSKSKSVPDKSSQIQEEVYTNVEQMPEYPGGDSELRNFIGKSVKYPPEAAKKGIKGKVFVSFVVSKDGSIIDVKILRGVDPLLDAEALRVVNAMPKWSPGKDKGKIVAVQYTIPINFALK
jgi:protein TonB